MKKQILFTVLGIFCLSLLTNYSFAQPSLQLTPSAFNGYAVSCFGGNNGAIDLIVTGGTAPLTYLWSNTSTTQDISGLRAGYYHVLVTDANAATAEAEITLTEPLEFGGRLEASKYNLNGNIFNVSCAICSDGSITTITENGIAPLAYLWENSSTNQNRSGLPEGIFKIMILDANGCRAIAEVFLDAPERTDWKISGNANTNPANNFIGNTDSQDVSFRTDNLERFRIKGNGDIILPTLAPASGYSLLGIDSTGKAGPINTIPILTPWYINGNNNINDQVNFLGPTTAGQDLVFKTNPFGSFGSPTERMRITDDGRVFMGTSNVALASDFKLAVNGNIITEKVLVSLYTNWPDYVFEEDYKLLSFNELEEYIKKNNHLPGMPSAAEVKNEGQDLGAIQTQLVMQNEELILRIIELNKRIEKLEQINR